MKHTMSMYATKDAMIDAMQADIDSLEAQLAEEKYVSERALNAFSRICVAAGIFPDKNQNMQIDKTIDSLETQLAEARKDSERLDYFEYRYLSYTSYYQNERLEHEIEHGNGDIFTGYNIRQAIDNAMKGGE